MKRVIILILVVASFGFVANMIVSTNTGTPVRMTDR